MAKKKVHKILFDTVDPDITEEVLQKYESGEEVELPGETPLVKSILNTLDKNQKIHRISFERDPSAPDQFAGLYYDKINLLPDRVLKKIVIGDTLVSAIIQVRASQGSPFGRELETRFGNGFRIEPTKSSGFDKLSQQKKDQLLDRAKQVTKLLATCGSTDKWDKEGEMLLSTFLHISAKNAVTFGRFATEVIWVTDLSNGNRKFHSIRPTDPGTIYKAIPHSHAAEALRRAALKRLEQLQKEKLKPEKFENDEYAWIQVIQGTPVQAFGPDEMLVHNCYPSTDIELNGYPVTPIDTAVASITTHINITTHNKFYFQQGRASRGMLVVTSDDVDPSMLADLKQQFNAVINSTMNAWRIPVMKVGKEDNIEWKSIDNGNKDMEFQFLADSNAREILSAFQMSPEEIPGYAHLSKGTNSQALSESSNEYKLEAARDVGIRPLLSNLQDFLNSRVLPLLDEEISQYFSIRFHGLEAETAEKEATRIEHDMAIHMDYDEIRMQVEKTPLGKAWGGEFPLNPSVQATLDKYFTVGQIKEYFFGLQGAAKDPKWDYARDPFYFQNVQLVMQQQQMEEQKQMAQQQMEQQQQNPEQGQGGQDQQQGEAPDKELESGVDQLIQMFSKSESDIIPNKRKFVDHHNAIVKSVMDDWEKESEKLLAEVAQLAHKNKK